MGKYLKYAIGEILLVVIGILIALQVNNWKAQKTAKNEEITILQNIKEDIVRDTLDLVFNIEYNKRFLKAESQLLNFLQSDQEAPVDSINYSDALGIPLFSVLHKSTFNNLQNNDIGLITNNLLFKDISRFYDFFANALELIENEAVIYETYDKKKPYFKRYFKLSNDNEEMNNSGYTNDDYFNPNFEKASMILENINGAKSDEGFKIELNESILFRQVLIGFYLDMMQRIRELIQSIDEELEVLNHD